MARDAAEPLECADQMVSDALERASHSERIVWAGNPRIWLYATLTSLNRRRLRTAPFKAPAAMAGRRLGATEAVSLLPLECREALLLVVVEGFSYTEAGDILGVPRLGIANRVARARQILSEHLETPHGQEARGKGRTVPHLRLVK